MVGQGRWLARAGPSSAEGALTFSPSVVWLRVFRSRSPN